MSIPQPVKTVRYVLVPLVILVLFGCFNKAYAEELLQSQASGDSLKLIQAHLDSIRKRIPLEKIYIHTNKPNYNLGDTLWFKGYVTDGNGRPSRSSGLLYVELNDDSTEAVRRVSLLIKEGAVRGQIPLPRAIFHEGAYTLRAYTNVLQNFGDSSYFHQRFYLGVAANSAWLAKSSATVNKVAGRDQLNVDVKLSSGDRKPLGLKNVEVKVYEGKYYLYKDDMQTGIDGSIKLSKPLKDSVDVKLLRVQITSLEKADKNKRIQIPLFISRDQNLDLQFLPEGGKLVAGLRSRVGFKAIGEDGRGVDVAGDVMDSKGKKVASFTSAFKGMGNFSLLPVISEHYTVRLTKPNVAANTFKLPIVSALGTVLSIDAVSDSTNIIITLQGIDKLPSDSGCYLIGTNNGRVQYSEVIDRKKNSFVVPKMQFPSGVARFTLFKGNTPINERTVFIDHRDRAFISITSNKAMYSKRDSVTLTIAVKDRSGMPLRGNFSLSVTDNSQVRADTGGHFNIAPALLLKAGLMGNIEDAGYYFRQKDTLTSRALDNLMLTQGWVGYEWKDVFAKPKAPKYRLEKDFKITGKAIDLSGGPLVNSEVLISSQKPSFVITTTTDTAGRFAFSGLPAIDSGSFFLQVNNKKGKHVSLGDILIDRFRAADVPETINDVLVPWNINSTPEQIKILTLAAEKADLSDVDPEGTLLRNVNIKSVKKIAGSWHSKGFDPLIMSFDEKEIKESAVQDLYHLLKQKVPGFKVIRDLKFGGGMATIKLDDRSPCDLAIQVDGPNRLPLQINDPTDVSELIDALSEFKIANFAGIEVLERRPPGLKCWYVGITTKNDVGWFKRVVAGTATYRPLPVMHPKQFYSPQYQQGKQPVGEPDYRSAIYWTPDIYTDFNGIATVSFCTSDLPANYTINIQGNTPDGELGSAVTKMVNEAKTTVAVKK